MKASRGKVDPRQLALAARKALGLAQRELAALLGVGHVTVARWETSGRDPGGTGEALFRLVLDSHAGRPGPAPGRTVRRGRS